MKVLRLKNVVGRRGVIIPYRIVVAIHIKGSKISRRIITARGCIHRVIKRIISATSPNKSYIRSFQNFKAKSWHYKKCHQEDIIYKKINSKCPCDIKGINASPNESNHQNGALYIHGDRNILINLFWDHLFPLKKSLGNLGGFFKSSVREKPPIPEHCYKRIDQKPVCRAFPHESSNKRTKDRPKKHLIAIKLYFSQMSRFGGFKWCVSHSLHPFNSNFSNNLLISRLKWQAINHLFHLFMYLGHTRKGGCSLRESRPWRHSRRRAGPKPFGDTSRKYPSTGPRLFY